MGQTPSEALEHLLEVGRLLSSKLDLGELLQTIVGLSSNVVDAETGSLLLLDEKTSELYFDVALGLEEPAASLRLKLGQGIAGSVAKEGKPAIINDVRQDARWTADVDTQSGFSTRSILAAPLIIKGRTVGVVEAINKCVGDFDQNDLRTFEAFASQAAVAIENARLFSTLMEESFKLNIIFSEMADAAILCDGEGKIMMANASARTFLGVGSVPKTLQDALNGFGVTPSLREIIAEKQPSRDFVAAREEPQRLVLAGKVTRLQADAPNAHAHGAAPGWLCVFRDETEKWHREKLKKTFLSLISHKLKTPLASVTGFSEILLDEFAVTPPSPLVMKAAQAIHSQGFKLAHLVDKLLRYTTLESPEQKGEYAPCSVDDLVCEALDELKNWLRDNGARVEYTGAAGVGIIGERSQLREVIKNLIENGVKFDPKPQKMVRVMVEPGERMTLVRFQDTGRGILPEDQGKIFSQFHQIETFFTGQVEGWGLGLPYVKKVVENHGGKIELKSRIGEGTTVTLSFPKTPA